MNASLSPPRATLVVPSLPSGGADEPPSQRHRTIWISDEHLGTAGCKAEIPLDFPKRNDSGSGLDGGVCGHIHRAENRMIDGMLNCNDGDWVETFTALVEDQAGQLHLVEWKEIREHAPALEALTP